MRRTPRAGPVNPRRLREVLVEIGVVGRQVADRPDVGGVRIEGAQDARRVADNFVGEPIQIDGPEVGVRVVGALEGQARDLPQNRRVVATFQAVAKVAVLDGVLRAAQLRLQFEQPRAEFRDLLLRRHLALLTLGQRDVTLEGELVIKVAHRNVYGRLVRATTAVGLLRRLARLSVGQAPRWLEPERVIICWHGTVNDAGISADKEVGQPRLAARQDIGAYSRGLFGTGPATCRLTLNVTHRVEGSSARVILILPVSVSTKWHLRRSRELLRPLCDLNEIHGLALDLVFLGPISLPRDPRHALCRAARPVARDVLDALADSIGNKV